MREPFNDLHIVNIWALFVSKLYKTSEKKQQNWSLESSGNTPYVMYGIPKHQTLIKIIYDCYFYFCNSVYGSVACVRVKWWHISISKWVYRAGKKWDDFQFFFYCKFGRIMKREKRFNVILSLYADGTLTREKKSCKFIRTTERLTVDNMYDMMLLLRIECDGEWMKNNNNK